MASSSNPRSNSSGSRQKPTYRKAKGTKAAGGAKKTAHGSAAAAPRAAEPAASKPASKPASYAVPPQRKRSSSVPAPAARQVQRPSPQAARVPAQPRPNASAKRARTASAPAAQTSQRTQARQRPQGQGQDRTGAQASRQTSQQAPRSRGGRQASPRGYQSVPASRRAQGREPGAKLFSRVPIARNGGGARRTVLLVVVAAVVAVAIAATLVAKSGLFLVQDIQVNGGEHVDQETLELLLEVEEGTTLFNVDEDAILSSLARSPWVADVQIERQWPHTLVITPVEYTPALLAYSSTDDVAWLMSLEGTWITPVSLTVATDESGEVVDQLEDGTWPEGATELSGEEAALAVASVYGAILVTDISSDVSPAAGETVESEELVACLTYITEFSSDFLAQIKSFSASSVESIAANLTNGVEVALGEAEDIATKEKVVTKLLEEQEGVTYINVREADAYTFRSTPTSE